MLIFGQRMRPLRTTMLKQLTIQNFVLVSHLDISFASGLTTITGESGAGKSILLGALGLLLGDRARADVVGPDAAKTDLSAEFELAHNPALANQLRAADLLDDDATDCLLRRVVNKDGRSRAFINATPVTLQYLREITERLVDVQGQNEHQRVVDKSVQLLMLDEYGELLQHREAVTKHYRLWQQVLKAIEVQQGRLSALEDRKHLLSYQLEEFTAAELIPDELESLEREQKDLSQAQNVLGLLEQGLHDLDNIDSLRHTIRNLNALDNNNANLESAQATLSSALSLLDDATRDLRHFQDQVVVDPGRLSEVEQRLELIIDLARKHKTKPEALLAHQATLQAELDQIDADSSELETLFIDREAHHAEFLKHATTLAKKRRAVAPKFAEAVNQYIHALGINEGALSVELTETENELGLEQAEFMVTTSKKFAPAPLARVASGGEQTRIGLAIQIVAAERSAMPCLILDEADVGVGGTTADTIGRILRNLAKHTQVLCVTHAPQVAALGDNHLRVSKANDETQIEPLDSKARVDELARMLAGADVTEKTREYANTLLAGAKT